MGVYLRLSITDTLRVMVDGGHAFNPLAKVTRAFWYRLPADWICDGRLTSQRREQVLEHLYGPAWRDGQGDGSRYVILELHEQVLSEQEAKGRPWLGDRAAFYVWRDGDRLEEVVPAKL